MSARAINRRYGRRALSLNRGLSDEVEREVAAVVPAVLGGTWLPGGEPGAIDAILAYVRTMLERLDQAPRLVVRAGRLADIGRRLEEDGRSPA